MRGPGPSRPSPAGSPRRPSGSGALASSLVPRPASRPARLQRFSCLITLRSCSSSAAARPCPPPPMPCRAGPSRSTFPETHFVNGAADRPAVPRRDPDGDLRPRLLLGRREGLLADAGRRLDRGRLRRRLHAEPRPTRRSARGGPATPRSSSSSTTRRGSRTTSSSRSSGRPTTRPRACARATTPAPSTARSSSTADDEQRAAAEASRDALPGEPHRRRLRPDHDRDRRRRASSTTPRATTSSTWPRTRTATARTTRPA